jgi:hypothetical protein
VFLAGHDISIPGNRPVRELEALSTIARAIRGERVRLSMDSWSFAMHSDRVDEFFTAYADRPESGMVINLDGRLDLDNQAYQLGPITYHAPKRRARQRCRTSRRQLARRPGCQVHHLRRRSYLPSTDPCPLTGPHKHVTAIRFSRCPPGTVQLTRGSPA